MEKNSANGLVVTASRVERLKRPGDVIRAQEWLWRFVPDWERRRGQKFYRCTLYLSDGVWAWRIMISRPVPTVDELITNFNECRLRWEWEFPGQTKSPYFDMA